jgi:hypothetical protein
VQAEKIFLFDAVALEQNLLERAKHSVQEQGNA